MSEKIPADNGDMMRDDGVRLDPELQKEVLKLCLEEWSEKVLSDDGLYEIIAVKLIREGEAYDELPDFSVSPNIKSDELGHRTWGIRISESVKKSDKNLPEKRFGMAKFKHIPILRYEGGDFMLYDESFVALTTGGKQWSKLNDEERARVKQLDDAFWLPTVGLIQGMKDRGVEFGFTPSGELMTIDELSRTAYASE